MNTNIKYYLTNTNLLLLISGLLLIILIFLIYKKNQIQKVIEETKLELKIQKLSMARPQIFIYLDLLSSGKFAIVIKNLGNTVTNNIRIKAEDKLIEKCDAPLKEIFRNLADGKLVLTPGQTYFIDLRNPQSLWDEVYEVDYEYTYSDVNKDGFNQLEESRGTVNIDFTLYKERYLAMHDLKVININSK